MIGRFLSSKWVFTSVLIASVAFTLVAKYFFYKDFYIKGDEPFMIFHCQQSFSELMEVVYSGSEPNPPLIFILLHIWIKLFGSSIIAVKSLPILISGVSSIFILLISKRLKNIWFGVFVIILFNLSPLHFEISQEVKGFALTLMLSLGSFYFYISYLKTYRNSFLLALILFNVALPYTHYNSVLVPIIQFLTYPLFIIDKKQHLKKLVIGNIISLLLFSPQLFQFFKAVPDDNFWLQKTSYHDLEFVLSKVVGYDGYYQVFLSLFFISPFILLVLYYLNLLSSKFSFRVFSIFWVWFIIPILINFIIGQYIPSFRLRYVYFTSIAIHLTLGYILFNITIFKNTFLRLLLLYFPCILFIKHFKPYNIKNEDWKKTEKIVKSVKKSNSIVIISAPYKVKDFLYYYNKDAFNNYKNMPSFLDENKIYAVSGIKDTAKFTHTTFSEIFFIKSHYEVVDPNLKLERYLLKKYNLLSNLGKKNDIDILYFKK